MFRFATSNPIKAAQARTALGWDRVVVDPLECDEPQTNVAKSKLAQAAKAHPNADDLVLFVEDTALFVPELFGMPGVMVKHYSNTHAQLTGFSAMLQKVGAKCATCVFTVAFFDEAGDVKTHSSTIECVFEHDCIPAETDFSPDIGVDYLLRPVDPYAHGVLAEFTHKCHPRASAIADAMHHLRFVDRTEFKGAPFYDISPCLASPLTMGFVQKRMRACVDEACAVRGAVDKAVIVVAVEARGFLFAPNIASHLGARMYMARKKGKLPMARLTKPYNKEYEDGDPLVLGLPEQFFTDCAATNKPITVILVDDFCATGGTLDAVAGLAYTADGVDDVFALCPFGQRKHGLWSTRDFPTLAKKDTTLNVGVAVLID